MMETNYDVGEKLLEGARQLWTEGKLKTGIAVYVVDSDNEICFIDVSKLEISSPSELFGFLVQEIEQDNIREVVYIAETPRLDSDVSNIVGRVSVFHSSPYKTFACSAEIIPDGGELLLSEWGIWKEHSGILNTLFASQNVTLQ